MMKKIVRFLKVVWWALVYSSKNPKNISLMVKGVAGMLLTQALLLAGVFHFSLPEGDIRTIIDAIVYAVEATLAAVTVIATAVSTWAAVWGGIRKVYLTLMGENRIVQ